MVDQGISQDVYRSLAQLLLMKPVLSILVSMMTTHFSLAKMCRYDISIGSLKVVDQGISQDVYRSLAQLLLMKPVLSILVSMMTTHFSLAKMCHYDISIGSLKMVDQGISPDVYRILAQLLLMKPVLSILVSMMTTHFSLAKMCRYDISIGSLKVVDQGISPDVNRILAQLLLMKPVLSILVSMMTTHFSLAKMCHYDISIGSLKVVDQGISPDVYRSLATIKAQLLLMKPVLSILVSMMTTHFSLAKMCRYDISIGSLKVVDQGISPDVYRILAQLLLMKPVLSILVSMMTTHFSLAKMCRYDISIGSLKVVDQGISQDVYRSLAQLLLMKPVLSILVSMMTTHFSLAKMCRYDISIGSLKVVDQGISPDVYRILAQLKPNYC